LPVSTRPKLRKLSACRCAPLMTSGPMPGRGFGARRKSTNHFSCRLCPPITH
jgi:hypothetical protein